MKSHRTETANYTLLPGEASTVLNVVVFYFASSGVVSLLVLLGVVAKWLGWSALAGVDIHPLTVLVRLVVGGGYLWTAWLLSEQRTLGGVMGLAFLALSIVLRVLTGGKLISASLLLQMVGVVGLALAWSYRSDGAARSRAAHPSAEPRQRLLP